jgi:hypothetical protein
LRVSFLTFAPQLASARYRQHIPMIELQKLGVQIAQDADIIVCSKHGWDASLVDPYKKVVYDVCDDHMLPEKKWAEFYRQMIQRANLVTCNSSAMRFRIFQETGKSAVVIPDPYETEVAKPSFGDGLLWFGHDQNLPDLWRVMPTLEGYAVQVISKQVKPLITEWSPEAQAAGLTSCAVVILPTGKSACKSANRAVEALRAGKFVVANPLPAYDELSDFIWVGDLRKGIDWAHANQAEALYKVAEGQKYVAKHFSPSRIAGLWKQALESLDAS